MNPFVPLALLLSLGGCLGLYLSSRHQRLLRAPLPARPARWVGSLLVLAALPLLGQSLQPWVALYVLFVWTTLLLMLLPYAALLVGREEAR
ncbi:hypothetical protein MFUL124B02_11175 [Myxococcus fulvus 124B02]|nr:hypothetical protein MFUL124B02_11175 [Myxococcus fulvus 124B02]